MNRNVLLGGVVLLAVFIIVNSTFASGKDEIIETGEIEYKYEKKQKIVKKTKEKYLDVTYGVWYLNWEQNDSPDNSSIDFPIEHKFKIKNSIAHEVSISGKYRYVKANIRFITSEGNEVANKKSKIQKLLGTFLVYHRKIDSVFRYISSNTDGNAKGFDEKTKNTSYIEFSTDVRMLDLIFYPRFLLKKYVGIGIKYLKYNLPQSFYIINNGNVISRMIEPSMQWKGKFFTLEVTNLRKIIDKSDRKSNFSLFGDIKLGYAFSVDTTGETIEKSGSSKYLKGDKGYFTEIDLGGIYFRQLFGRSFYLKGGYRYSIYVMETEKDKTGLYIYARAKSVFSGPYINISVVF